eukprot:CAMPEP_0184482530 /NCGR_PEP_ID=MMETSP0113_2-20130426/4090_1 /TAXON_ID=91329 /ORGANISM="Norrisiella sphaerica, Strain BC52" /LENGTH=448 /DNA_ID=CAMNT_0026862313 /DNA_START=319 /DNA_END=1665 /DNA_ORIENTATION=-
MISLAALTYTPLGGFSSRIKVLYPFIIVFVAFLVQTVASLIPPDRMGGDSFFCMTVILVTVCGACNALIQAGLFGLASRLPTTYVQGLMAGQGMGGLLPATLVVMTVALGPAAEGTPTYEDVKWSALSFFSIASVTAFLAIVAYICLERLPLLAYYGVLDLKSEAQFNYSDVNVSADSQEILNVAASDTSIIQSVGKIEYHDTNTINGDGENYEQVEEGREEERGEELRGEVDSKLTAEIMSVALGSSASTRTYMDIRSLAWGVFVNYFISLAVFPSVTANIYSPEANAHQEDEKIKFSANPREGRFYGDLFVPIYCFLFFNLFDFIGRSIAGRYQCFSIHSLLPLSILRVIFIPLFMLCNVVEVGDSMMPAVFKHVAYPIIFMVGLALSNGYLSTLQFMKAPALVPDALQDSAGRMMCFFVSAGLLAGSTTSFLLHYLLCSCNPILR